MKFLAFALLLASATFAQDATPPLVQPGTLIAEPDLKSPLPADWAVQKGTWEVKDGEMTVSELKEQKHAAVLWHKVTPASAIVECEFKFDGASGFLLGCDGGRHIGRLVITKKGMKITEDSTEVKGQHAGATLAEAPLDLKQGEWYKVRYEWAGDKMAATIGDKTITGSHETFSQKRSHWWFAVGGATLAIRNIKVWEGK